MTAPWVPGRTGATQEALADALDELRGIIERRSVERVSTAGAAIDRIAERFALSGFERDLLLLCAGIELDAGFAQACRAAAGGPLSFGFALAALPGAHWSAITPAGPLRHWRLIELRAGEQVTAAPIAIDERVLHFIAGVSHLDERLQGLVNPASAAGSLTGARADVAARIAATWRTADQRGEQWPPVQLVGPADAGMIDVAVATCAAAGLRLYVIGAADLPAAAADRAGFERLWAREAAIADAALLIQVADADGPEVTRAATAFALAAGAPVLIASRDPLPPQRGAIPRFAVAMPSRSEQADLWRRTLGAGAAVREPEIERVTAHFDLGPDAIAATGARAEDDLWKACRDQARGRMEDLAQRIETAADWDELVLPPAEKDILREIVANVRQRVRVYEQWGFAGAGDRGLGVSALFAGGSGTGKTMAAEIVARELDLDLYRIDLSQVVSKYIGETEKNLRRVFDSAETAGAVLLFDEADALFGKRSEVKDSHDRYANLEVSYLLQRMECYRGLAILTTNLPQAIDPAFRRRLRFIVQFPFPDRCERAEIWRRIFPRATPTERLDILRLAQLNVAGGNIRNIALGAAFLAADADASVSMAEVRQAARAEYAKIGRALTPAELAGWDAE